MGLCHKQRGVRNDPGVLCSRGWVKLPCGREELSCPSLQTSGDFRSHVGGMSFTSSVRWQLGLGQHPEPFCWSIWCLSKIPPVFSQTWGSLRVLYSSFSLGGTEYLRDDCGIVSPDGVSQRPDCSCKLTSWPVWFRTYWYKAWDSCIRELGVITHGTAGSLSLMSTPLPRPPSRRPQRRGALQGRGRGSWFLPPCGRLPQHGEYWRKWN